MRRRIGYLNSTPALVPLSRSCDREGERGGGCTRAVLNLAGSSSRTGRVLLCGCGARSRPARWRTCGTTLPALRAAHAAAGSHREF